MSFVLLKKFLKKIILASFFSIFLMGFSLPSVHAGWATDLGKMFTTGNSNDISFTQYSGQLAQLDTGGYDTGLTASTDLKSFILKVVNYALGFLGLIAVLIVIYGGVLYVTAAGEDEKVGKAKKAIGYAAVGLLIVMGSFAFVNTIIKGGTGGAVQEGGGATAITASQGFNASAEEVKALAVEIYNGFAFLAQSTEDFKNIEADGAKDSLKPTTYPSKNEMLTFLNSIGSKLKNMKESLQPFTKAEVAVNNALRDLAKDIDSINSYNESVYMTTDKSGKEIDCDINAERAYLEERLKKDAASTGGDIANKVATGNKIAGKIAGDIGGDIAGKINALVGSDVAVSDLELCLNNNSLGIHNKNNIAYDHLYPKDLMAAWTTTLAKYTGAGTNPVFDGVIQPIALSYESDLERIFGRLEEIYGNYSNVEAIGGVNSIAFKAYSEMKVAYGYTSTKGVISPNAGLLQAVKDWKVSSSIDDVGVGVVNGLKHQSVLYDELKKLQFVQARLTADVVEGSAPLTVNFNALATVDPAGGSVQSSSIVWDLAGTQTVANLTSGKIDPKTATGVQILVPIDPSIMNCTFAEAGGDKNKTIGTTAQHCVYTIPGTYTAAVKINSNNPSKYAPGISILTIKVKPPTTKIELTVQGKGEQSPHTVMHYDGDILSNNESTVQVTTKEASDGVTFDAKGTKDVRPNGCKWDFGDGKVTELQSCDTAAVHPYKVSGKYLVTLHVVSLLGVEDRKIFTMDVDSIAASLKATPHSSSINETVLFDASASKSDLGHIKNFKWTISRSLLDTSKISSELESQIAADYPPFTIEGATFSTITQTFKYSVGYTITLEVTDDAGNSTTAVIPNYQVISKSPVAQFDYQIKDKSQPATVYLDGIKSYDPDGTKDFTYKWTVNPACAAPDCKYVDKPKNSDSSPSPVIKFKNPGSYTVTLRVSDPTHPDTEYSELSKTIKIDNVLDVAWDTTQVSTQALDEQGKADIVFKLLSENAKTYEINFGDGETGSGDFGEKITHTYTKAGKFTAKVTVYDASDKASTTERKIFISAGDQPIAKARFFINSEEVQDLQGDAIQVSKQDVLTFDASDSKNSDGSTKNLKYSWDFGDGKNSSKLKATHTYHELSPKDPGFFKVKLSVYDSNNTEKVASDEFNVQVVNMPPTFSSISAVPQPVNNTLTTPVSAVMKVYGANDPDGQIVKYKWWYFDVKNPDQQFGVQITTAPTAKLTIGTRGKEGDSISYGFGLEVTDSDGLTYSNEEAIQQGQVAKLDVVNGANALPTAKFAVNNTSVFAGDKVTFTSSSTDPDGAIAQYIWDFEGDGFFNDEPTDQGTVEHVYTKLNKAGYDVRLKVVDDKGGESISDPIKVHVDSLAKPPVAGFTFASVPGSDGMKIQFTNTSTADTTAGADILSYQWDYDTDSLLPSADSNGDGNKANDTDSQAKDPERLYAEKGSYKVKLTVTDTQGNKDEVTNTIKIPMANPPQVSFTSTVADNQVVFTNTSKGDVSSGSIITKNIWDFDTNTDSDGDGKKDNDNDSALKDPTYAYSKPGTYKAKLTVIDNQGGVASVVNEVNFNPEVAKPVITTPGSTGGIQTGGGVGSGTLKAILLSDPAPSADSAVYLPGTNGNIKFDFSKSTGAIQYYIIDKNIYFDTDGDGDKTNDADFKTSLPGTWSTGFDKSWGQTVVKLTVTDIYGNKSSATEEIKFK